jgi:gluconate 2-dehydrogenase gamma chain
MAEWDFSRRRLLEAGGALGALPLGAGAIGAAGVPWRADEAAYPLAVDEAGSYNFFSQAEAAFIVAAVARMIPADELGGGAIDAGVPIFLDRQLAGEFGQGTRWYMHGPWAKGLETQGYQSRMSPAQMYRAAIAAIDKDTNLVFKAVFARLKGPDQDAYLTRLETGDVPLGNVDSKAFFTLFLQNVIEGFFCDPIHGGNRDMIGWKLIGFPGARYDKRAWALAFGKPYDLPPVSIGGRPGWLAPKD